MSVVGTLFGTIGGLGLFLYGMGLLSDGLKRIAGDGLRRLLARITKWSVLGLLIGAGVTCLIQSSSGTTVMVVGLVNAGLLSLRQAISVVLGANIGTTFTAWLVAGMGVFKITNYALPAVGIGFALHALGRRPRTQHAGRILLGFGILFIGIAFMKEAFEPLGSSEAVRRLLMAVGDRPILGVLAGAVITMLLQSSSASIAMIQALAISGAFGGEWELALASAIPFVLGDNIGTTITAQIAAARTNLAGRRTAMAHTVFNVLGVALLLPLVYAGLYPRLVQWIAPFGLRQGTIMAHIAISHSLFNVIAAAVALPLLGLLERAVTAIVPARKQRPEQMPVTLEYHLLDTPSLAIEQARREIHRMCQTARHAVHRAVKALLEQDAGSLREVARHEQALDERQTEITRYLVELSQRDIGPEMAGELPVLMHTVNDLERIGDHATNIAEIAERRMASGRDFSDEAVAEIVRMRAEVAGMFDGVLEGIGASDRQAARAVLRREETVNELQASYRQNHVRRLRDRRCEPLTGMFFVDYVDNMEKIGDHLTNIAEGVLSGLQWGQEPDGAAAPPSPGEPALRGS